MVVWLRKRLWVVLLVVAAAALAFAGPSIIAGMGNTAVADGGCGMMGSQGTGSCSMQMNHGGCAMLSGTVTSIDKRDGSVTVKITPTGTGADAARKALGQVKVGQTLSMAMVLGAGGAPVAVTAGTRAAKYACPMHPEVTSNKPGKCPKCGMDLQPVTAPK